MATLTNNTTTNKIIRIQKDEKQLLAQLREIYGNDYKKYFECIRRGTNIPLSLRKIYRLLDERKAYRRISDYFHRERIAKKSKRPRHNALEKSSYRSSTRQNTHLRPSLSMDEEMDDEDENIHQQSTRSTMTNNSEEFNEGNHRIDDDDTQDIQPISSINFIQPQKQNSSLINNREAQIWNSQSNLLSIRSSIQKALRELDHAIILKTDNQSEEHDDEQQRSSILKVNEQSYTKLDDLVRSLSSVVNQQQENVRLIINESSVLLPDDTNSSENLSSTTHESIKHILERLNTLVDRGHTVYDRIESILSEF